MTEPLTQQENSLVLKGREGIFSGKHMRLLAYPLGLMLFIAISTGTYYTSMQIDEYSGKAVKPKWTPIISVPKTVTSTPVAKRTPIRK
ncbi:MAG: hypothetical protein WCP97_02595 [bacterium]